MATKIFRPYVESTEDGSWTPVGGDEVSSVDPGDDLAHDDATSMMGIGSGLTGQIGYTPDTTFDESMIAINSVVVWARARYVVNGGATQFRLNIVDPDGTTHNGSGKTLTTSWADYSEDFTSVYDWIEASFRDADFEWLIERTATTAAYQVTSIWVEVDYVPGATKVEASRRTGSRRLRLLRQPMPVIEIDSKNLEHLKRAPGDVVGLSHFAVPHASNVGAQFGIRSWERIPYFVLGRTLNPETMSVRLRLLDARPFLVSFWDTGITDLSSSAERDGIAALDAGATRTFSRDSAAWVEDPGDGRIVQIGAQDEKNAASGFLIEGSATNYLLNSCFASGVGTGWSSQGTGVNGSAVENDTSVTFWDTAETAQSCKITAGNPLGGTAVAIYQTSATITANTIFSVSITHLDDSAYGVRVLIIRSTDGYYYSAATGWQSGYASTLLPTRSSGERDQINNIDVGGSNATITIYVAAQEHDGQINHIGDVQIEDKPFATSRIKTTTSTVTRAADELTYSNDSGSRVLYPDRHTGFIRLTAEWSSADLESGDKKTIFYCYFDATNEVHLYYDETSGAWIYEETIGGTTYQATKTATVTKGTSYDIAWRRTSDEGELDLTNYTLSIFVDGVKGTDDDAAASGAVADCDLLVGRSAADTDMLDGWWSHFYMTPLVFTDEQVARLP